MKSISSIEFYGSSKEERLPDFLPEFPYLASRAELDKYRERFVPWHWHKALELFYVESGAVEYCTTRDTIIFPAGYGGLVNSNVLHMTRPADETASNVQMNHLFEPSFLAGESGSRIEEKYVTPIIGAFQLEILVFSPQNAAQQDIITLIQDAFRLSVQDFGYEIRLREMLSEAWIRILKEAQPLLKEKKDPVRSNDKIKSMMIYIQEHYAEKISVTKLAAAAFTSERECFRVFRDCLHTTPAEYIKNYRLHIACRMLIKSRESITDIGQACGLGSSSYFGRSFREAFGCTPLEYRQKWQNNDR